jgi:hypothetical protein
MYSMGSAAANEHIMVVIRCTYMAVRESKNVTITIGTIVTGTRNMAWKPLDEVIKAAMDSSVVRSMMSMSARLLFHILRRKNARKKYKNTRIQPNTNTCPANVVRWW